MLSELENSGVDYYLVGNFDPKTDKILYIASSVPTAFKDKDNVWCSKVEGVGNVDNIKQQCLQFLKKCGKLSNSNIDVKVETYTSSFANTICTNQLVAKTGYIDVDMEESEEIKFPTDDWLQTIKAGILPLPENNTNISDINIGVIGNAPLKIQTRGKTNTIRLNGNWSKYTGTLTVPSNITKIYFLNQDILFNIVANHNLEFGIIQPTQTAQQVTMLQTLPGVFGVLTPNLQQTTNAGTLKFTGDLSKCTGTINFDKSISKIVLPTDKPAFTIGGDSNLVIGVSGSGSNAITLKSSILNRKGAITLDESVKTVTIE